MKMARLSNDVLMIGLLFAAVLQLSSAITDNEPFLLKTRTMAEDHLTNTSQLEDGHISNPVVTLLTEDGNFDVELELNRDLFAENYHEKGESKANVLSPHQLSRMNCYYTGKVRREAGSMAAFSTCNGLEGYFTVGRHIYSVEPLNSKETCLSCYHRITRRSRVGRDSGLACGALNMDGTPISSINEKMVTKLKERATDLGTIEIYIINDYNQYKRFGQDKQKVFARSVQIMNAAAQMYKLVGLTLQLVGQEIFENGNPFKTDTDHTQVIKAFTKYVANNTANIPPTDDVLLMCYGVSIELEVVGVAWFGSVCRAKNKGLYVVDDTPLAETAATFAHEFAHTFGLEHDTAQCTCTDPTEACIMQPGVSKKSPSEWSSCSLAVFSNLEVETSCLHTSGGTGCDKYPGCAKPLDGTETGTSESGSGETGTSENGSEGTETSESGSGETGTSENGSEGTETSESGSGETETSESGSGETETSESGSGETETSESGSGEYINYSISVEYINYSGSGEYPSGSGEYINYSGSGEYINNSGSGEYINYSGSGEYTNYSGSGEYPSGSGEYVYSSGSGEYPGGSGEYVYSSGSGEYPSGSGEYMYSSGSGEYP
jgi:hypothetical protein